MAQQKLYTEEDVLKMLRSFHTLEINVQLSMYKLTPIELPSDEEIEIEGSKYPYGGREGSKRMAFIEGAKWMRNKILNQNK